MLTEICQYLKNWEFDLDECPKIEDTFTIEGGEISALNEQMTILPGQYFRIIGSMLNDGVHLYPDAALADETFNGAVWLMSIPQSIVNLADDIGAWVDAYENAKSTSMTPYNSETFGGYAYSKSGSGASVSASGLIGWQAAFADRLNPWRKI